MTFNELIKKLNKLSEEDAKKEIRVVKEPNCGIYLCTDEDNSKVKPVIEVQDLSK